MNKDQREIQRKLRILRYAGEIGHVAKACRYFGIGRASFYRWRKAYAERGEAGLINCHFQNTRWRKLSFRMRSPRMSGFGFRRPKTSGFAPYV